MHVYGNEVAPVIDVNASDSGKSRIGIPRHSQEVGRHPDRSEDNAVPLSVTA